MEHLRAVVNANDTFDLQRALQTFNSPVPRNISNADRIPTLWYFFELKIPKASKERFKYNVYKKKKIK